MTDPDFTTPSATPAKDRLPRSRRRTLTTSLAAAALLLVGAGAGAGVAGLTHRSPATFDTALATTPIAAIKDTAQVEIAGKVAEIFGNKFVVEDAGGQALVETGRAGEGRTLVAKGEAVTIQGRFADGFLHASALQRADGSVKELRPEPPRRPHGGPGEFLHGPRP